MNKPYWGFRKAIGVFLAHYHGNSKGIKTKNFTAHYNIKTKLIYCPSCAVVLTNENIITQAKLLEAKLLKHNNFFYIRINELEIKT